MTLDPALITRSFAAVEPHGSEVTRYFYQHLFTHHPGVRGLFADHLDAQQDRLWAALGTLVTHLEDTETLLGVLRGLGRRHAAYGAEPDHYPAVGASLVATLAHFAGDAWDAETEAAWAAVYGVVSATMAEAMAEAMTEAAAGAGHTAAGPAARAVGVGGEPARPV